MPAVLSCSALTGAVLSLAAGQHLQQPPTTCCTAAVPRHSCQHAPVHGQDPAPLTALLLLPACAWPCLEQCFTKEQLQGMIQLLKIHSRLCLPPLKASSFLLSRNTKISPQAKTAKGPLGTPTPPGSALWGPCTHLGPHRLTGLVSPNNCK